MKIFEWMMNNWDQLIMIAFALVGAFSAIAKITPTQKDDVIADAILKVINALALNPKKSSARKD
jgi:hypothetical protein|tara:strand:- start:409 stop:600 length:192 start_codon:yes stop_codon:yes gene_type:complete